MNQRGILQNCRPDWRILGFCLLLGSMAVLCPGCSTYRSPLEGTGRVTYYDRNGDGKVDLEIHHFPGVQDADWQLWDDDFDGRYEKKVVIGVGIFESAVDLPVPTNVHITKEKP